mmetsp:Transcript_45099/g.75959  ORF Transcript_45099/g.75959 Transcript_45099/m.75959 type:complete len:659 (+) Transcript_45099:786-2762(+)
MDDHLLVRRPLLRHHQHQLRDHRVVELAVHGGVVGNDLPQLLPQAAHVALHDLQHGRREQRHGGTARRGPAQAAERAHDLAPEHREHLVLRVGGLAEHRLDQVRVLLRDRGGGVGRPEGGRHAGRQECHHFAGQRGQCCAGLRKAVVQLLLQPRQLIIPKGQPLLPADHRHDVHDADHQRDVLHAVLEVHDVGHIEVEAFGHRPHVGCLGRLQQVQDPFRHHPHIRLPARQVPGPLGEVLREAVLEPAARARELHAPQGQGRGDVLLLQDHGVGAEVHARHLPLVVRHLLLQLPHFAHHELQRLDDQPRPELALQLRADIVRGLLGLLHVGRGLQLHHLPHDVDDEVAQQLGGQRPLQHRPVQRGLQLLFEVFVFGQAAAQDFDDLIDERPHSRVLRGVRGDLGLQHVPERPLRDPPQLVHAAGLGGGREVAHGLVGELGLGVGLLQRLRLRLLQRAGGRRGAARCARVRRGTRGGRRGARVGHRRVGRGTRLRLWRSFRGHRSGSTATDGPRGAAGGFLRAIAPQALELELELLDRRSPSDLHQLPPDFLEERGDLLLHLVQEHCLAGALHLQVRGDVVRDQSLGVLLLPHPELRGELLPPVGERLQLPAHFVGVPALEHEPAHGLEGRQQVQGDGVQPALDGVAGLQEAAADAEVR